MKEGYCSLSDRIILKKLDIVNLFQTVIVPGFPIIQM